jgi:hypothetical protein
MIPHPVNECENYHIPSTETFVIGQQRLGYTTWKSSGREGGRDQNPEGNGDR